MADVGASIPSLVLNDGTSMPMLAYGTGTSWKKSADDTEIDRALVDSIKTAIRLGYHHLDGAAVYNTEPELGLAIQESGVDRGALFVTTKVLHGMDDIPGALAASLAKLRLQYVDLYLIHAPFFAGGKADKLRAAWRAMEDVRARGLARSIGVSNYDVRHVLATLEGARVVPAVNQVEFHPYLQQDRLLDVHRKHGIVTQAYGPLAPVTKFAAGPVESVLVGLARKYGVGVGEVLLRWCIDRNVVAVTTSSKEQRLSDYLRCLSFKLEPREIEELNEVGDKEHHRGFWLHMYKKADDRS